MMQMKICFVLWCPRIVDGPWQQVVRLRSAFVAHFTMLACLLGSTGGQDPSCRFREAGGLGSVRPWGFVGMLLASVWSWPSPGLLWRRRLGTKQTPQGKVPISTPSANDWCLAMPESEIGDSILLSLLFGKLYICSAGFRIEWSEVNIRLGF